MPYCVHGKWLGYPGGPDYMCGLCEEGRTVQVQLPKWEMYRVDRGERRLLRTFYTELEAEIAEALWTHVLASVGMELEIVEGLYVAWVTPEKKAEIEALEGM